MSRGFIRNPVPGPSCRALLKSPSQIKGRDVQCPKRSPGFKAEIPPVLEEVPTAVAVWQPPQHYQQAGAFQCVYCKTTYPPVVKSQISTSGWITAGILLLSCFGAIVAWIPLLCMHEQYRVCSGCGIRLG